MSILIKIAVAMMYYNTSHLGLCYCNFGLKTRDEPFLTKREWRSLALWQLVQWSQVIGPDPEGCWFKPSCNHLMLCAVPPGTSSTLAQSLRLKLGICLHVCWELTCDGMMSHPEGSQCVSTAQHYKNQGKAPALRVFMI